ncbi:MAG: glycosyltransferase family 2 protein [Candidatus Melainabacteria bacterium HGW-Melainabacteria-1]|nr:MAG: glycosyltransferase family 2 protein [Candidatus Melainabacteria bacterium HGW-Melainabacteria-1]
MLNMQPLISIIVPIRNEAAYISRCLNSLAAQDYPQDRLEVLIVDGRSDDGTQSIVAAFAAQRDWIRLLDNPEQTAPYAMNYGLDAARGEIIVRVDGHCELAPDYLRTAVRLLAETGAACVGGPLISLGDSDRAQAIALAMSSPFGVGNAKFRYADQAGWVDTLAFGAYQRNVFETVGRFNPELTRNQDDEFNWRLRAAGLRIWLSPELKSVYYTRGSYRQLWRQYYQYGFWKIRVIREHPGSVQARHLIPAGFVLALGLSLLGLGNRRTRALPLAVLGPYALGAMSFGLRRCRRQSKYLPAVLAAFPVLHLGYGFGFLAGLAQLLRARRP